MRASLISEVHGAETGIPAFGLEPVASLLETFRFQYFHYGEPDAVPRPPPVGSNPTKVRFISDMGMPISEINGAETGIRTRDLILTMDALCQLSYLGLFIQEH